MPASITAGLAKSTNSLNIRHKHNTSPGLAMAKKARLIPRKFLSSDESIVFEARPSAWLYMKSAALAIIVALVAFILFAWDWIPNAPDIPYVSSALSASYGDYVHWAFGALFVIAFGFFSVRWLR